LTYLLPVRDGPRVVFLVSNYKMDCDAMVNHVHKFVAPILVLQMLWDNGIANCERGHPHYGALSLIGDTGFCDVLAVCDADDADVAPCCRHLQRIGGLDQHDKKDICELLFYQRVADLEEQATTAIFDLKRTLAKAATGASKRFYLESLHFRETCFNRIHNLHFRTRKAEKRRKSLFRWLGEQELDVDEIHLLHEECEIDRRVKDFVESLKEIQDKAIPYVEL